LTDPISLLLFLGRRCSKRLVWNLIGMKFGRFVLPVNTHRLTESDFLLWHHSFKMAAITSARSSPLHMWQHPPTVPEVRSYLLEESLPTIYCW